MVFGKTPYAHITNHFTKVNSICSSKPVSFPTEIKNKQLMDVMKKCLEKDPKKRPSIAELLTHPYLMERSGMFIKCFLSLFNNEFVVFQYQVVF